MSATTKNQLEDTNGDYVYDAAGNLINPGPTETYTFDAENHLTSAGGLVYLYDGDGKRVAKAPASTPTQPNYLYWYGTGSQILEETNGAGAYLYGDYYFNGMLLARGEPDNWVDHFFADALGNTRSVYGDNDPDGGTSDYYPFGGERPIAQGSTDGVNVPFKFTGKERDSESTLDNFGARYDSSSLGRFMGPDPLGGHRVDPQTLNKYSYVRNNPLNLTDPTGLDFNLTCSGPDTATCEGGLQGTTTTNTDANGNQTSTFTATVISNDKNGNLVDQSGNQYNATVSGAGVSFSQAGSNQPGSMGVFINNSNATTIQGTGGLSGFAFNFTYSNWAGNVTAGGTFSYNGTFQQAESALENAGFHHYASDEYDIFHPSGPSGHAVDFRSAGDVGTGAGAGHFTVDEPWMFYPYDALRSPTNGDVHLGEHNNSTPGGFWPHTGEVLRTLWWNYLVPK